MEHITASDAPVFRGCVLFVTDIARSRAVYEGAFGLVPEVETPLMVAYKGGLAIWEATSARTVVYGDPMEGVGTATRHGAEVWFETNDPEGSSRRVAAAGLTFLHPVREEAWGQKTFRCFDPDGHLIEVGETMAGFIRRMQEEGMDTSAIAEKTGMTKWAVQEYLEGRR